MFRLKNSLDSGIANFFSKYFNFFSYNKLLFNIIDMKWKREVRYTTTQIK